MPRAKSTFRARRRRSPRWSRAGFANTRINGCGCIAAGGKSLSPGFHPRPEPVDNTLGSRIARGDHEQLLECGPIRVDVLVLENLLIDPLLARQIAVGVRSKTRI